MQERNEQVFTRGEARNIAILSGAVASLFTAFVALASNEIGRENDDAHAIAMRSIQRERCDAARLDLTSGLSNGIIDNGVSRPLTAGEQDFRSWKIADECNPMSPTEYQARLHEEERVAQIFARD